MKIAVIETGAPPRALAARFGTYADMFRRMLGPAFTFREYAAPAGDLPAPGDPADAVLITGSPAGVHDGDAWIQDLRAWVADAAGVRPMLGVCFGHQLMAEAFGGRVSRSAKGWGVGLHRYDIREKAPFMDGAAPIHLPASHQDQVVEAPPGARVLAGSDFTPFAMLHYPGLRALSVQPHPEFEPDFARALIDARRGGALDEDLADRARASLRAPNDRRRVEVWLRRFLHTA